MLSCRCDFAGSLRNAHSIRGGVRERDDIQHCAVGRHCLRSCVTQTKSERDGRGREPTNWCSPVIQQLYRVDFGDFRPRAGVRRRRLRVAWFLPWRPHRRPFLKVGRICPSWGSRAPNSYPLKHWSYYLQGNLNRGWGIGCSAPTLLRWMPLVKGSFDDAAPSTAIIGTSLEPAVVALRSRLGFAHR